MYEGAEMSAKPEDKYFESLNKLLQKTYELKSAFIDEPLLSRHGPKSPREQLTRVREHVLFRTPTLVAAKVGAEV